MQESFEAGVLLNFNVNFSMSRTLNDITPNLFVNIEYAKAFGKQKNYYTDSKTKTK